MQAYLNLLPLPNSADAAVTRYAYNYQAQESLRAPKVLQTTRIDYIVNPNNTLLVEIQLLEGRSAGLECPGVQHSVGLAAQPLPASQQFAGSGAHPHPEPVHGTGSEGSFSRWTENGGPLNESDMQRLNRNNSGANIAQLWPGNNPRDLVPNATFGGISNPPNTSLNARFPLRGAETPFYAHTTLTNTRGAAHPEIRLYAERWRAIKGEQGNWNGTIALETTTTTRATRTTLLPTPCSAISKAIRNPTPAPRCTNSRPASSGSHRITGRSRASSRST